MNINKSIEEFTRAKKFFRKRMVHKHIDLSKLAEKDSDYKSQVIEWAQKNKHDVVFESYEEAGKRSSSCLCFTACLTAGVYHR